MFLCIVSARLEYIGLFLDLFLFTVIAVYLGLVELDLFPILCRSTARPHFQFKIQLVPLKP